MPPRGDALRNRGWLTHHHCPMHPHLNYPTRRPRPRCNDQPNRHSPATALLPALAPSHDMASRYSRRPPWLCIPTSTPPPHYQLVPTVAELSTVLPSLPPTCLVHVSARVLSCLVSTQNSDQVCPSRAELHSFCALSHRIRACALSAQ